jgi:hypothetical protein
VALIAPEESTMETQMTMAERVAEQVGANVDEFAHEDARLLWLYSKVLEGRGAVMIGETVNGNVGIWIGEPVDEQTPGLGYGDSVQEAIEDAMRREHSATRED